jgi:hypothetical protein
MLILGRENHLDIVTFSVFVSLLGVIIFFLNRIARKLDSIHELMTDAIRDSTKPEQVNL